MTVVHDLRVDAVVIGERLRPLSEAAVNELAESIRRIGQIQPITVNRPNGIPRLVTGHHRLIAARRLGLETIASVILPVGTSDDDCLQIEIAENLHRNDLTKDERDRHIRLLAEIIGRQGEIQVSQNAAPEIGYGKPPPQTKGVVSKVAEQVGLSKDTVRRALNPEATAVKKASIQEAADRAEAHAAAKRKREADQAEHDRQRDEHRAGLSPEIQAMEVARAEARKGKAEPSDDRVEQLEAEVAELRIENAELKAELAEIRTESAKWDDMRVLFEKGGFEEVVAAKDEVIRTQLTRIERESHEKVTYLRSADFWKQKAKDHGYSADVIIDAKTGELRNA